MYGYAGMDEEEKSQFASSIYSEEREAAVAFYTQGQVEDALHKMENALSVISYADKYEEFGDLTKLAVEASFKIGDYEKAVFHQEKLLRALDNTGDVVERAEGLYLLGILYSRLERFRCIHAIS